MNYCIKMDDGSLHAVTQDEARLIESFLHDRLCHGPESGQDAVVDMLAHVRRVMRPETQFDTALYTPSWYQPGWAPSAA